MTLAPSQFAEFFAAANGYPPFGWQQRLFDQLNRTGVWPMSITAPTGTGKSNVVDVHVFACALMGIGAGPRVPRRLSVVVDRRAIVDSHQARALRLHELLNSAQDGVLCDVREALEALRDRPGPALVVASIRGGMEDRERDQQRSWLDEALACTIISATPDMWGSRLLLRGYGSTRAARPREGGLLALDSVLIVDEAHLNRHFLLSARAIANMTAPAAAAIGSLGLQTVEMTATPVGSGPSVGVVEEDFSNETLSARLKNPKVLTVEPAVAWPAKGTSRAHCLQLADAVSTTHTPGGLTGCIVNRVQTALEIKTILGKRGYRVGLWVGRLRPMDLDKFLGDNAGLFDPEVPLEIDMLVATQSIEVGVDLDFTALVTELASGTALTQRMGRVNRHGKRASSSVTIIAPSIPQIKSDCLPYRQADLVAAREWCEQIAGDASGWAIQQAPPPPEIPARPLPLIPTAYDAMRWARTSDQPLAEEDLDLWLADDLENQTHSCGLVLRDIGSQDDIVTESLLRALPPVPEEVFPADVALLRHTCGHILAGRRRDGDDPRVWLFRDGEVRSLEDEIEIRPGDIAIANVTNSCTLQGVVTWDPPTPAERLNTVWGDAHTVIVDGESGDFLLEVVDSWDPDELLDQVQGAFGPSVVEVSPERDERGRALWLIARPVQAVLADEARRQVTSSLRQVLLASHQRAVADRARSMAERLGLSDEITDTLEQAGLHHDDGKGFSAFQRMLNPRSTELLAKCSPSEHQAARRRYAALGLNGWRHEQRSAGLAHRELGAHPQRDLITRLVGTSHGHGRGLPPNSSQQLIDDSDDEATRQEMVCLFDEGGWDELVTRTDLQMGTWTVAYLEALLRAADSQVSKEGS